MGVYIEVILLIRRRQRNKNIHEACLRVENETEGLQLNRFYINQVQAFKATSSHPLEFHHLIIFQSITKKYKVRTLIYEIPL